MNEFCGKAVFLLNCDFSTDFNAGREELLFLGGQCIGSIGVGSNEFPHYRKELMQCQELGWELATHTWGHRAVRLGTMTKDEQKQELITSIQKQTDILGCRPVGLIPPFMSYDKNTVDVLRELSFKWIAVPHKNFIPFTLNAQLLFLYLAFFGSECSRAITEIDLSLDTYNKKIDDCLKRRELLIIWFHLDSLCEKFTRQQQEKFFSTLEQRGIQTMAMIHLYKQAVKQQTLIKKGLWFISRNAVWGLHRLMKRIREAARYRGKVGKAEQDTEKVDY